MQHYSILKTNVGYVSNLDFKLDNLITTIVQNSLYKEGGIVYSDYSLFLRNIQVNTPITYLFEKLAMTGKLDKISYIYVPTNYPYFQKVQSILGIPYITYYLKDAKSYPTIAHIPELSDKVLINLTLAIKENKLTQEKTVSDIGQVHSAYVRAYAHYDYMNSSDMWLPMDLSMDILHLYTYYFVSNIHSKLYLSTDEISLIRALIGLYYVSLLSSNTHLRHRLFLGSTFLGTKMFLEDIFNKYLGNGRPYINITELSSIAADFPDYPRAKDLLTYPNLIRIAKSLHTDTNVSFLALEFPPYWVFTLLNSLSFSKSHLYFTLKKDKSMMTVLQRFVTNYTRHCIHK